MKIARFLPLHIHRMVDENRLLAAFRREPYLKKRCFLSNSSISEHMAERLRSWPSQALEEAIILLDNEERQRDI
jgi:hypothetical protein